VVLLWTIGAAALIALLLCVVNAAFDYAKIATVLEGRQRMLSAAARGFRFVLARPFRTLGLYFTLAVVGLLLLAAYRVVAPGARDATLPGVAAALLLGQIAVLLRLVLRLTFYASQMALYESVTWRAGN
jgi:hypothetical protein